jgi:deazaflavin-dependent oxidoreductase (nitroreductase family)
MPEYIPSPRDWVREQVELYERTNGAEGTTLRDTGLPVVIVTNIGNKTGAIRKTPLMRVKVGDGYVLVGSVGGAPKDPVWVYNLRANPLVELRDLAKVRSMRVREVTDAAARACGRRRLRPIRRMRITRRRPPDKFRYSSPNRCASGYPAYAT